MKFSAKRRLSEFQNFLDNKSSCIAIRYNTMTARVECTNGKFESWEKVKKVLDL